MRPSPPNQESPVVSVALDALEEVVEETTGLTETFTLRVLTETVWIPVAVRVATVEPLDTVILRTLWVALTIVGATVRTTGVDEATGAVLAIWTGAETGLDS